MSPLTYESAEAKVATTMRIAEVVAYADGEDEGDEEDERSVMVVVCSRSTGSTQQHIRHRLGSQTERTG